jgi:hypothetical protein
MIAVTLDHQQFTVTGTAPRLENLAIRLFSQLTFFIPHLLLQFMRRTESLSFGWAYFYFILMIDEDHVEVYPHEGSQMYSLSTCIGCSALDWQVFSFVQGFTTYMVCYLKSTLRSTTPIGGNFLDHLTL